MSTIKSATNRTSFIVPSEIFSEEPKPFDGAYARRCFRVLRMVTILHGKGFQGLRVFPYEYPLAYRIEIYPSTYTHRNGVKYAGWVDEVDLGERGLIARYSGASDAQFFGWDDVESLSAHQLSIRFIERFPDLARAAYHFDFAYAGWYAAMLAHCEYGYLPHLFAEYEDELDVMRMRAVRPKRMTHQIDWFPLPPSPSGGVLIDPRLTLRWMEKDD